MKTGDTPTHPLWRTRGYYLAFGVLCALTGPPAFPFLFSIYLGEMFIQISDKVNEVEPSHSPLMDKRFLHASMGFTMVGCLGYFLCMAWWGGLLG